MSIFISLTLLLPGLVINAEVDFNFSTNAVAQMQSCLFELKLAKSLQKNFAN
jgi:hypothetical protein